jgi:hypothetical protein
VANLIREKAEGHPFFTEEACVCFEGPGVNPGRSRHLSSLPPRQPATESVQLPNSVQVMVSSRIDQLNVEQQLTLKGASIFGRTFELAAVRAADPIDIAQEELQSHVGRASSNEI